ncbi:MAG TPA: DUF4390 domain-containing protein [Syntrophobacteraceae bacterium]|nr:DUF4390 domain-containing protein [Syntrophobacteraceae bacterium]
MTISFICRLSLLFLSGFVSLLPCSAAAAGRAEIVEVRVTPRAENLELGLRIQNCFTPKMEEAILSGVLTTFRIRIVLERSGPSFLRARLLDTTLDRTVKYEPLGGEFRVKLPEQPDRVLITKDFHEAKGWMSRIRDLPIISLDSLQRGVKYELRIKAELSKFHLPLFFRYIFFFVSMWDFETDWHKVPFSF